MRSARPLAGDVGGGRPAPLRRGQPESGGLDAPKELAALHGHRAVPHECVAELLRDVVVITVETAPRNLVRLGERMELRERLVTRQMAPSPTVVPPARLVDQDRHAVETGTLAS